MTARAEGPCLRPRPSRSPRPCAARGDNHTITSEATTIRKFLAALLAAALLFPVIVAPVAAVGEGGCENLQTVYSHVGDTLHPSTFTNVRGIRSQIFDQQDLDYCTSADLGHGPSYWVALQPSYDNPEYNNPEAILQIGVIKCQNAIQSACTGSPRYFWADGGCNGDGPVAIDLGPAPIGGITFAIRHVGNSQYWLTAVPINSNYPTISVYTEPNSTHIGCWALGGGDSRRVAGAVYCERWDNGDNCGGIGSSNPIDFTTIRFWVSVNGQWYIPGNSGSPLGPVSCSSASAELHCIDNGDDRFSTYAVQQ